MIQLFQHAFQSQGYPRRRGQIMALVASVGCSLTLASCEQVVTEDFEAIAVTSYTWQAEYRPQGVSPDRPREARIETFESNSVLNMNGQPTVDPTGNPDEQGLWWPMLPPEPTVDELEARQKPGETFSRPEIQKSVDYTLTFDHKGNRVTLPTQYAVYREAVKAYEQERPLQLTLGAQDSFVQAAEMQ